jgi:hypothetical protein
VYEIPKTKLIVCSNREWLRQFLDWDGESIDVETDIDRFLEVLVYNLEDHDFEVVLATGLRSTFHGWNGAKFKVRLGVVATDDILSPTDQSMVTGVISFAFDRIVGGVES